MKKLLALLLALTMVFVLVACSAPAEEAAPAEDAPAADAEAPAEEDAAEATGEPVEVSYWVGSDLTGGVAELKNVYEEANPNVTINIQEFPGNTDDRKKSLITAFSAGDTEPDVFTMDIVWTGQFAAANWLMDVTSHINPDDYLAGPLSAVYTGDVAYAFPNYTDAGLLYYRSDLIPEEEVPTTWDELDAVIEQYQGDLTYGYLYQAKQSEAVVCNALEFIKQNGGNDVVNNEVVINSPEAIEGLEYMLSMIDNGVVPEGVLTAVPDDNLAIFQQGDALFMRNWTYAYARTQLDESLVKGNVGVAALPVGPNGDSPSGTLGGWNHAVSVYTDQPDAAAAFAAWASGAEGQKISTIMNSTLPTWAALYEDADAIAANPLIGLASEALDTSSPRPLVADYPSMSTAMQVDLHKILTKEVTVEEGVALMAENMQATIDAAA